MSKLFVKIVFRKRPLCAELYWESNSRNSAAEWYVLLSFFLGRKSIHELLLIAHYWLSMDSLYHSQAHHSQGWRPRSLTSLCLRTRRHSPGFGQWPKDIKNCFWFVSLIRTSLPPRQGHRAPHRCRKQGWCLISHLGSSSSSSGWTKPLEQPRAGRQELLPRWWVQPLSVIGLEEKWFQVILEMYDYVFHTISWTPLSMLVLTSRISSHDNSAFCREDFPPFFPSHAPIFVDVSCWVFISTLALVRIEHREFKFTAMTYAAWWIVLHFIFIVLVISALFRLSRSTISCARCTIWAAGDFEEEEAYEAPS